MKLIQELLALREEAIETKPASDVWKENKDKSKTYITTAVYYVKDAKDGEGNEVYQDKEGKRKLIATVDDQELDETYVPVRSNQTKDAEGYILYRDSTEMDAFKYDGDTVKLDLEGATAKIKKGDYLVRTAEGDNFVYSVETAKHFEDDYTEKK